MDTFEDDSPMGPSPAWCNECRSIHSSVRASCLNTLNVCPARPKLLICPCHLQDETRYVCVECVGFEMCWTCVNVCKVYHPHQLVPLPARFSPQTTSPSPAPSAICAAEASRLDSETPQPADIQSSNMTLSRRGPELIESSSHEVRLPGHQSLTRQSMTSPTCHGNGCTHERQFHLIHLLCCGSGWNSLKLCGVTG